MRLIKQTDSVIVLQDHFPVKFALPFGLALTLGGAVTLIITTPQVAVLNCYRQASTPTCELWRNNRDFTHEIEPLAIGAPQQALIQASNDSKPTYQLAIQSDRGIYPIVTYYRPDLTNLEQQQRQLEDFIANPTQAALVMSNVGWWNFLDQDPALIIVLGYADFLVLAGLIVTLTLILFSHPTYRFDRVRNKLIVKRRLFGIPQKEIYPLSAVRSVVLEESLERLSDDENNNRNREREYHAVYRISIYLVTDKRKRLGPLGYDTINVKAKRQLVQALSTFLGLLPPGT